MKKLILLSVLIFLAPKALWAKDLAVGDTAPAFTAADQNGKTVSLKDFSGKTVVLYFYPKDDTPGCTIEAKSFRDLYPEFQKKDVVVLGVSYDSSESHAKFKDTYQIPYPLLSDPEGKIAKAYGADGVFFASRETYVIDPEGKIRSLYKNVNPSGHAEEVLKGL